MKKHVSLFFVLSFVLVSLYMMESCSKSQTQPGACIESITTPATIGSSVTFVSCTSGASSYTWSFGDGTSATGDSVLHTYGTVGTFRGSLTVVIGGSTPLSLVCDSIKKTLSVVWRVGYGWGLRTCLGTGRPEKNIYI